MSEAQKQTPEHRLLLVTLTPDGEPVDESVWVPRFDLATDWYRYSPYCWFLWTSGTPETWLGYLESFSPNDALFVIEVGGSTFAGNLPKGAWQWMSKYVALRHPV
jgi:hypothetical protein